MQWEIDKIIEVASAFNQTGNTACSTGERIAAAFVINRLEYLPEYYSDAVEAWDRLGEQWQGHVRLIKQDYMHLIGGG